MYGRMFCCPNGSPEAILSCVDVQYGRAVVVLAVQRPMRQRPAGSGHAGSRRPDWRRSVVERNAANAGPMQPLRSVRSGSTGQGELAHARHAPSFFPLNFSRPSPSNAPETNRWQLCQAEMQLHQPIHPTGRPRSSCWPTPTLSRRPTETGWQGRMHGRCRCSCPGEGREAVGGRQCAAASHTSDPLDRTCDVAHCAQNFGPGNAKLAISLSNAVPAGGRLRKTRERTRKSVSSPVTGGIGCWGPGL